MQGENEFGYFERNLIDAVKRTLKILAKVIRDRNPGEVIKGMDPCSVIGDQSIAKIINETDFMKKLKDFDPDSESENSALAILVDQLAAEIKKADPERKVSNQEKAEKELEDIIIKLAMAIRGNLTPDLPGLNPKEFGNILGQLGPSVFGCLMGKEEFVPGFDKMFSIPTEPMTALAPGHSRDLGIKHGMKAVITDIYLENNGGGVSYFEILEKTGQDTFELRYRFRTQSDQVTIINFNTGLRLGHGNSFDGIRIQNSTDSQDDIIARVNGVLMH